MHTNDTMRNFVTELLRQGLPREYYYHDLDHSLYVSDKAIEIGKAEHCTAQELRLLETAGLWHDTGFIEVYNDHEAAGVRLVRKWLPEFGYSQTEIEKIAGMIAATKIPQSPHNKLEEIIADADLEYLGTDTAASKAFDLYRELKHLDASLTNDEWNIRQVKFISGHHYFTKYCIENKEPLKQEYIKSLQASIPGKTD